MPYNDDITWAQFAALAQVHVRDLRRAVAEAKLANEKFLSFRNARNDATLAADTSFAGGVYTEAQVTEMRVCFRVLGEFWDCMNDVAVTTSDRQADLDKFA